MHNSTIDSRASSSIMPRCVVDQQVMKYEPMIKHVLQLDGTSVTIIGILKGLKMALHACPSCFVVQDMYIVEIPQHFSLCILRDFTT